MLVSTLTELFTGRKNNNKKAGERKKFLLEVQDEEKTLLSPEVQSEEKKTTFSSNLLRDNFLVHSFFFLLLPHLAEMRDLDTSLPPPPLVQRLWVGATMTMTAMSRSQLEWCPRREGGLDFLERTDSCPEMLL